MTATTFDQVLTSATALPEDLQELLESLLCKRRLEAWRRETAVEAKAAARALRSGKLKPLPVEDAIGLLRSAMVPTAGTRFVAHSHRLGRLRPERPGD